MDYVVQKIVRIRKGRVCVEGRQRGVEEGWRREGWSERKSADSRSGMVKDQHLSD